MKTAILSVVVLLSVGYLKSDEPAPADKAADPMIGREAGQVRDDNELKMKLIWCRRGFLTMEQIDVVQEEVLDKDDDGKDVVIQPRLENITSVKVFLTHGYWLGKYEVTRAEWTQLMASEPWKGQEFTKEGRDVPATWVRWDDAMKYCSKLTEREREAGRLTEGWEYTLPTEAEWERACRARTETEFSFGEDESKLAEYAWYNANTFGAGERYVHPVGQKKPNPWGLCDMHGNVCEWCRDFFAEKLPGGRDPEVRKEHAFHIVRGGGWVNEPPACRSAKRGGRPLGFRNYYLGFRVALSPVPSK